MLQTKIETLTPEQEKWIPIYHEKWKKITLSSERIDHHQVLDSIRAVYKILGKSKPEILFFDSPKALLFFLNNQLGCSLTNLLSHLGKQLGNEIKSQLQNQLSAEISQQLDEDLTYQLCNQLVSNLRSRLEGRLWGELRSELDKYQESQLLIQLGRELYNFIKNAGCLCIAPQLDFYISVLNLAHNPRQWEAYQLLVNQGSYILAFDNICLVSDCPTHLSFDSDNNFHAEGEPAIQFADGFFCQYIYRGVTIPEKYGILHPHQWQAKWILEEKNAEVRRLLIQTIGYGRICQELKAQTIDSYLEYTLLKIDEVDLEPMYLLKMTCPSTRHIHALRVPPHISSAREAIRWVNWGISPEEFAVQS